MYRPRRRKASWEIDTDRVLKSVRESLDDGISSKHLIKPTQSASNWYEVDNGRCDDSYVDLLNNDVDDAIKKTKDAVENPTEPLPYDDYDARKLLPSVQLHQDTQQTPLSVKDFMTRLSTYDILHWSRKPDCIASFHCARYGWQLCEDISGISALVCVTCKKLIPTFKDCVYGMSSNEYCQQLRKGVEESCHASSCPWRKYYSPVTILSLPQGFGMFHFVRDGAASFRTSLSYLCLTSHYNNIMQNLDLGWMNDIIDAGIQKRTDENDNRSPMMNQLIHFLVLNGWSMMATTIDDGISCNLCLRQIPLWFCKDPCANSEEELVSPRKSPSIVVERKSRELDPVNNHWWWCPWRRFLEFSEAADLSEVITPQSDFSSIFEHRFENSTCLRDKAECEDYLRLKTLVETECLEASSINKDKVVGPQLIVSIGTIMDDFVSSKVIDQTTAPCCSHLHEIQQSPSLCRDQQSFNSLPADSDSFSEVQITEKD